MKLIDLIYKIYDKELKENTLIKITYDNWETIEYWQYRDGRLYYTNEKGDYFRNEPMDLFSYLADRNILVEVIEDNSGTIGKVPYVNDEGRDKQEVYHQLVDSIFYKINEIIDRLNELLEKSDK